MATPDRDRETHPGLTPDSGLAEPSAARSTSPLKVVQPRDPGAPTGGKPPARRGRKARRPARLPARLRFRPQVGRLEPRALLTQININPYVNNNLRTYTNGTDYPVGGTSLTIGGVAFTLATRTGGGTGVIQAPAVGSPTAFDVPVSVANPNTVYALINSTYGVYGDTVGSVEFKATGGLDYSVNLVEGQDIRDHNNYEFNNTIGRGGPGRGLPRDGVLRRGPGPARQARVHPAGELPVGDPDRHHPARHRQLPQGQPVPRGGDRGHRPVDRPAHLDGAAGLDRLGGRRPVGHLHRDGRRPVPRR